MTFLELPIHGGWEVSVDAFEDSRGLFARTYCQREFAEHGLAAEFVQCSTSWNPTRGTLRGMHFQHFPSRENKLVRCTRGVAHDVLLDLRPDSPSYLSHCHVVLDADRRNAAYIPAGIAHGFLTLVADTEVYYQMTDVYAPDLASGVRFDDQRFGINWPEPATSISEKDSGYPDFDPHAHEALVTQLKTRSEGS